MFEAAGLRSGECILPLETLGVKEEVMVFVESAKQRKMKAINEEPG